jgi:hypothetical protein
LNSDYSEKQVKNYIETALDKREHQAFVFHKIGSESFFDYAKHVLTGHNNCFSEKQFVDLLENLFTNRDKIWIAPLIDILKYKSEYSTSTLELKSVMDNNIFIFRYNHNLDPTLYDQSLTIILPATIIKPSSRVYQDNHELVINRDKDQVLFVNTEPHSSDLTIHNNI